MIATWKLPTSKVYHGLNNALGICVQKKHYQVLPTQMVPISALAHGLFDVECPVNVTGCSGNRQNISASVRVHHTHSMMMSSDGNIFRIICLLWGESTGHRWIPSQRPVTRNFVEQTIEQTMEMWVIWDAMMFMWRHCNGSAILTGKGFLEIKRWCERLHNSDVTWARWRLKSQASRLFVQRFGEHLKNNYSPTFLSLC